MLERNMKNALHSSLVPKYQDIFMALYISSILLPWISGIKLGALYNV